MEQSYLKVKAWLSAKFYQLNNSPVLSNSTKQDEYLRCIQTELFNQEIGYHTSVNQLIDELFIQITRQLTRQNNPGRDFPKSFMKLEQTLRQKSFPSMDGGRNGCLGGNGHYSIQ